MPDFDSRGNSPVAERFTKAGKAQRGNVGFTEVGGVVDNAPPEVTVVSPAEGTPITASTPLVVDVTDAVDLVSTPLYAEFPGAASAEMVYQGATSVGGTPVNTGFLRPYASQSTIVDVAGGVRLSIRRDGGWPGDVQLTLLPVDGAGNLA